MFETNACIMKKPFILFLFVCLSIGATFAQGLDQDIASLASQVKPVLTKTGTIDQKLTKVDGTVLKLVVSEPNSKGQTSTETFVFNLADVFQPGVKQGIAGQVMYVEIPIKDRNKYVLVDKGGKPSYDNGLKILVNDIDDARSIMKTLDGAVAKAEKIELSHYSFNSQDAILSALFKAISANSGIEQKAVSTAEKKEKLHITINKDKKNEAYEFNLSDIDPTTIKVDIGGNLSITIVAFTNQKVIKQFENEVPKSYISKFDIYPKDVENAKEIRNLLVLAIENAKSGITSLPSTTLSTEKKGKGGK